MSKNSTMFIEINKTFCPSCTKPFYEFDGHELSECPHCDYPLGNTDYDSQDARKIYVDFKTGEIRYTDF